MKINIGPYKSDLIPINRLERRYERWRSGKLYLEEENYTWYDKIIITGFDKLSDLFLPINRWANQRKRKVKARIDGYDVWSAYSTLAMVIHPTLVKLKESQHGAGHVDPEDCPEHLKPTEEPNDDNGYVDNTHFLRWTWILDEMIWAFEQYAMDGRDEDQFHHNCEQLEMLFTPLDDKPGWNGLDFNYQKDPSKPKYWVDEEGKKAHYERKKNGLRLFAKYYESLWD